MNQDDKQREFVDLLVENQNRLFAYLFAVLRNRDDTEEVFQQTSLVLWRKFDDFELGTNFFRWAAQVAQYELMSFFKSRRRSRLVFSDETVELLGIDAPELDHDEDGPRRDAMAKCLDKLKPDDRKLVVDCYGNQLSVRELADELGRSRTSVHNSLRRIREWLMGCIERTLAAEDRT
ncbi:MAG: sigma-70 family RNA polymerase sigma factor [Pirellulales bacterium]|nr:sigma-70 family RNA polymerase sigma factor [Pirellulales bacterium]